MLALAVCCVVPVLCGAFALETNISYTRWWYGLALMLTLVTLTALEDFDAHTWRTSILNSDRADRAADRAVYASGKLAESAGPSR